MPPHALREATEATQTGEAGLEEQARALSDQAKESAAALSLHAEEPQLFDELPFVEQKKGAELNNQADEHRHIMRLLGIHDALESRFKAVSKMIEELSKEEQLRGTGLEALSESAALQKALSQLSPLQQYMVLSQALAQARQNGNDRRQIAQLEILLDSLMRSAGPELARSLRALASQTQAGVASSSDDLDAGANASALELLRTLRGDGVTLVQVLDMLQQQIGTRLHKALRTAAAEKEESIARLLETMRVAQLAVLIRSALDAARDLIAACDRHQTPMQTQSEVLAEHLLELLEDAPGKQHLQALAEQLLQPGTAKYGLFFTELRHTLNQRFALTAWRSLADRVQLLKLLDLLSGLPEHPQRPVSPHSMAPAA